MSNFFKKRRASYMKTYRRNVAMKKVWSKCHVCGDNQSLIILTEKDKAGLTPKEVEETRVLCARCLFQDQPLLLKIPATPTSHKK